MELVCETYPLLCKSRKVPFYGAHNICLGKPKKNNYFASLFLIVGDFMSENVSCFIPSSRRAKSDNHR